MAKRGEAVVIDVRPEIEFDAGHIAGAVNVPLDALPRFLKKLPKDQEIVAYCRGPYCLLAFDAVERLRQLAPTRCHHVGLLSVGVGLAFQRQGVARALMEFLVEHARACGLLRLELYVRADNERAQALYRSLGFEREATRARFIRADNGTFVDDHVFARFLD